MSESNGTPRIVFISWVTDCSRSNSIAKQFQGKSYLVYSPFWGSRVSTIFFKYAVQSVKTLWILCKEKPDVIFVMAPPIITCFPVYLYCLLSGKKFVIDSHTAAFVYWPWDKVLFLHRFFSRRALTTIVTGSFFYNKVKSWGANCTVVSDMPVDFAQEIKQPVDDKPVITLVCTFTPDEPLTSFLEATKLLPKVQFYITGNYKDGDPEVLSKAGDNVKFTGFLPAGDYVGLLLKSNAVVSLTTLDHTMQRGAYEAVYLGVPVITSNTQLLQENFDKGTVHVENTRESIVEGVSRLLDNHEKYKGEVKDLREEKLERWSRVKSGLLELMRTNHLAS